MNRQNTMAANLIGTRGNRATAAILGYLEQKVYPYLPDDVQVEVRQVVLDQINMFKDLAMDIVKSDTAILNQHWVEMMDQMRDDVRQELREIRRQLGAAHR